MNKILLVMPYFFPHKGGSQKYAEELYSHLIEQFPDKFKIDVLCYNTDEAPSFEKYRGLNIHRIPCWQIIKNRFALPVPWALFKKLNELSKNKYSYANAHLAFFDPAWWVWLFARLNGARSIFTEHCASFPVHQKKIIHLMSKLTEKTIGKFSINFYDFITVTNKAALKFLNKELGIKKRAVIIYGGVDTRFFSQLPKNKKRIIPIVNKRLKPHDILITYIGRIIWTKGITFYYDAIKSILPKLPKNIYFVIAGGGELEKKLKKQIKRDGFEKRVFMTGFIPYKQVRDLLRISDIFINPSHHNEGFPNTILEAGATGNFVIATNNAGTKEVIVNQKTGLLIPQKNQIKMEESLIWAINHPKKRKVMAQKLCQLLKKEFDWNILAREYNQLLSPN